MFLFSNFLSQIDCPAMESGPRQSSPKANLCVSSLLGFSSYLIQFSSLIFPQIYLFLVNKLKIDGWTSLTSVQYMIVYFSYFRKFSHYCTGVLCIYKWFNNQHRITHDYIIHVTIFIVVYVQELACTAISQIALTVAIYKFIYIYIHIQLSTTNMKNLK